MKNRYAILRFIGSIYKIIGAILAIVAVIGALGFCVVGLVGGAAMDTVGREFGMQGPGMVGGVFGGIVGALGLLIGVGIAAISQYAIGEAIYLFLSIEENTRATAYFLQNRETIPPSPAAPPVE